MSCNEVVYIHGPHWMNTPAFGYSVTSFSSATMRLLCIHFLKNPLLVYGISVWNVEHTFMTMEYEFQKL